MSEHTVLHNVSVLFTDLVGSSEIYDRGGDKLAIEIVETHFQILQGVLTRHGGTLIKTIGDALFGSFNDPAAAVRCAVAMHEALRQNSLHPKFHLWPVRIRAGVHAGGGIQIGGDIFGDTVNVAARVVGIAGEDEVMCTREVVDRLPPDMAAQFDFHAPIVPKGTLRVVEVHRWRAGRPKLESLGRRTMQAAGAELEPTDWKFDDKPREAYLVLIHSPDGSELRQVVRGANVIVGRESRPDLPVEAVVKSQLVSRAHLGFTVVRGQLWVFDLDSRNGVYLRYPGAGAVEAKVKSQAPVVVGTLGRFGDCAFACEEAPAGLAPEAGAPTRPHRTAGTATRTVPAKDERILCCGQCLKRYRIARYDPAKTYRCPACQLILLSKHLADSKPSDTAIDLGDG